MYILFTTLPEQWFALQADTGTSKKLDNIARQTKSQLGFQCERNFLCPMLSLLQNKTRLNHDRPNSRNILWQHMELKSGSLGQSETASMFCGFILLKIGKSNT